MTAATVRPATDADHDRIAALLSAADLPTQGVRTETKLFVVADVDGTVVGAGGLEAFERAGLLRSVVVADTHRCEGIGTTLCEELRTLAREACVETLFLLTTTAEGFFRDRGYEVVARDDVPASVRATAEFTDLCPASATPMRLVL